MPDRHEAPSDASAMPMTDGARHREVRRNHSYKATNSEVQYQLTQHEAVTIGKELVCELGLIEAVSYHGGGMNYRAVIDRYFIQGKLSNLIDSGLISLTEVRILIAEEERRRCIPPSHSHVPVERRATRVDEDGLIEWMDIE